jgi:hypothetical protein
MICCIAGVAENYGRLLSEQCILYIKSLKPSDNQEKVVRRNCAEFTEIGRIISKSLAQNFENFRPDFQEAYHTALAKTSQILL